MMMCVTEEYRKRMSKRRNGEGYKKRDEKEKMMEGEGEKKKWSSLRGAWKGDE